jgi:hypothetical protein
MDKYELAVFCTRIRRALDDWSRNGTLVTPPGLRSDEFPSGFCGFITEVLAIVIYRKFGKKPNQVCGLCEADTPHYNKLAANSHLWLEIDGITIDITGDQFNSGTIEIPPTLVSSSAHPLSKYMKTTSETAYIIGVTKEADSFDASHLRLASKIISGINSGKI